MRITRVKRNKYKSKNTVYENIVNIVIALIIALILNKFVISRASVNGSSMKPTLENSDVVYQEKISKTLTIVKKGSIITFEAPNGKDIYVKRVIATAGDKVVIKNALVYVNNKKINEPYLEKGTLTSGGVYLPIDKEITIHKNEIFVLGDNRGNSMDSRTFGPIEINSIKGHLILRLWPINTIRFF